MILDHLLNERATPSTAAEMGAHAAALRAGLGTPPEAPLDVPEAARTLGCRVLERRQVEPHLQAALVPATGRGFVVWLLKDVAAPLTEGDTPKDRFLILHELAHTFFYSRDRAPHRRVAAPANDEEFLCDVFAAAALVPDHRIAADIGEVAASFRAPEAVARWVRSGLHIDTWHASIDRCSGPGW